MYIIYVGHFHPKTTGFPRHCIYSLHEKRLHSVCLVRVKIALKVTEYPMYFEVTRKMSNQQNSSPLCSSGYSIFCSRLTSRYERPVALAIGLHDSSSHIPNHVIPSHHVYRIPSFPAHSFHQCRYRVPRRL